MAMLTLAACAFLASCGGGDGSGSTATPKTAGESEADSPVGEQAPGPYVEVPEGPPPKRLVVRDIEEGTGAEAKLGDMVTVRYVGVNWAGQQYSNAWTYPEAPSFKLGGPELERGFGMGVEGMRVGGRREVIVPTPLLAHPGDPPLRLPSNQTVVFLVDLYKVG
jgi:peptidylprolyl isomerase